MEPETGLGLGDMDPDLDRVVAHAGAGKNILERPAAVEKSETREIGQRPSCHQQVAFWG